MLEEVIVEGNRKTRRDFVLREMSFQVGDSLLLDVLEETLVRQRQLLLNTNLFADAAVLVDKLDPEGGRLQLRVLLREKWYFYPSASLSLADRNFNIWWTEQGRDLSRLNYGLGLKHGNTSGRADRLRLNVQGGYTRKFELRYELPYIDKAKILGMDMGILLDRNREWGYRTEEGIMRFYGLDSALVLQRRRYRLGFTLRPAINFSHLLRLERQITVADSVLATIENPNFLGEGRQRQRYWGLSYTFIYDRRDVRPFPLNGDYLSFEMEKRGLLARDDLNRLEFALRYARFQPLGKGWFFAVDAKVKTDVERSQVPYYSRRALGFDEDFLRGYQFFVVDGLDYGFLKGTLRYQVFDKTVPLPFVPFKRFSQIPLRAFLGVHGDLGAVRDPFNTPGNVLANRALGSYGVGAYFVLFYGKVLQLEYSRNDLGTWGLFLSYSLAF